MRMPLLSVVIALSLISGCGKKHRSKSPDSNPEPQGLPQGPLVPTANPIQPVGSELMLGCDSSNRQLLWGQMAVDSDLMQAFTTENSISLADEKVAFVDSGLDKALASRFPGSLQYLSATDYVGEPETDASGHGSFVAGLIAAQEVGLAPGVKLTSYKFAKPGGYNYSDVYAGARKACADGNKLINVSQGFWYYEPNPASESNDFKDTLAELRKSGCIMIKASGNDAFQRYPSTFVAADSVLHVEAASVSRSLSKFSSNGEVRAPGSMIASISSTGAASISCQNSRNPAIVSSGTSFAAPIVTGILAHVRAHIKKSLAFQVLPPEQQADVLQNIVKASELGNMVNGYRAVVLAKLWRPEMSTVENMQAALSSSCPQPTPVPSCEKTPDALSYLSCMSPVRRSLALCSQSLSKESIETFLEGLLSHKAVDLWLSYAAIVNRSETLQSTAAQAGKLLAAAMPTQLTSFNNYSWLEGLDVIAAANHFIASKTMHSEFLYQYTQSAALLDALNKANGRDGNLRDSLKTQLAALLQFDPEGFFTNYKKAYTDWNQLMANTLKYSKYLTELVDSMGRIRFQNLLRSLTPQDMISQVDSISADFFQKLLTEYNETPLPISGQKPMLSSFQEDDSYETWDGAELSVFYQNRGLSIDLDGSPTQLLNMPASFVAAELAIERKNIVEIKTYPKLSLFVLQGLSKLTLWKKFRKTQDRILQAAIMNLQLAINTNQEIKVSLQVAFKNIVDTANHSNFKFSLLDPYHFRIGTGYITYPDGTSQPYPLSNLVDTDMRRKILLEVIAELPFQLPETIVDYAPYLNSILNLNKDLLPKSIWQTYKAPSEWIYSEWTASYISRLNKTTSEPKIFRNTQGQSLPVLFSDALSSYLRAANSDIQTTIGYRLDLKVQIARDLQNLEGFCQLADRSRLIEDVNNLIQTINTSPYGENYLFMKAELEVFKTQCLQ